MVETAVHSAAIGELGTFGVHCSGNEDGGEMLIHLARLEADVWGDRNLVGGDGKLGFRVRPVNVIQGGESDRKSVV